MGFHSPQRGVGGCPTPASTSTSPLAPGPGGEGGPPKSRSRGGGQERRRVPGKSEPNGPKGGRAAGGRGAVRRGNRKEAGGEGVPCSRRPPPLPYHTPGPRRGREGPASQKEAELTPRSSSERKSGPSSRPSCEVGGARRAGERMEWGRHKGRR